jgi:hypothetical protein
VRSPNLSVDVLAIAAAGAWLLAFGRCAAVTSRQRLRAGAGDPGAGLAPDRPALVNLSVTRCRLNGAAYPATILDLAAGGHLAITEREPGQLWCDVPASAPADTGLARSERLVLDGVRALAAGDGAPFEALAESCASDVRGQWDPFERAARAEGRRDGITRPRLSVRARIVLYGSAVGVGALAFAAVRIQPGTGLWAPAATAFFAVVVPAYLVHSLGRQDRLTAHGSAVGAWADRAVADAAGARLDRAVADAAAGAGQPGTWPEASLVAASSPAGLRQLARAVAAVRPYRSPAPTPGWPPGSGRGRGGRGPGGASPGGSPEPPVPPRPGHLSAGNGGWCGSARPPQPARTPRSGWCWPPGSP